MATTFTKIADVTVGSGGAAAIDFTSIPSTFTDLCLMFSLRSNYSGVVDDVNLIINGSSSSFSARYLQGSGSGVGSGVIGSNRAGIINGNTSTANTFGNSSIYIPNYAGSTNKSMSFDTVSENNATTSFAEFDAILWSNTAAITSITLDPSLGSLFQQYSTATLYGVNNA